MFEDIRNRLFGSIGSKIKTLAKLCCYFCLIVGFLCAFWGALSLSFGNVSEAYLSSKILKDGLILAIVGTASSWPLFGFGELIEKVSFVADRMEKIESKLSPAPEKRPSETKEQINS